MLRLVVFDMDGVLIDACEWHKNALNESLLEISNYKISEEDHIAHYNGLPTKVKLDKMVELGHISRQSVKEIYFSKQEKTKEIIRSQACVDESKIRLMEWLRDQGIYIACFTNSIHETAHMMLSKTGVMDFLELLVTNQDVNNPKPNPEGYYKALKHFDVYSSETMIVEDSPKGIQAALATGCKVMQVENATKVNIKNVKEFIDENFDSHGG